MLYEVRICIIESFREHKTIVTCYEHALSFKVCRLVGGACTKPD